jgi:hypothetical protein
MGNGTSGTTARLGHGNAGTAAGGGRAGKDFGEMGVIFGFYLFFFNLLEGVS